MSAIFMISFSVNHLDTRTFITAPGLQTNTASSNSTSLPISHQLTQNRQIINQSVGNQNPISIANSSHQMVLSMAQTVKNTNTSSIQQISVQPAGQQQMLNNMSISMSTSQDLSITDPQATAAGSQAMAGSQAGGGIQTMGGHPTMVNTSSNQQNTAGGPMAGGVMTSNPCDDIKPADYW